jgi:Large eukaryotic DNA virus major capsid protein/Major capsid protein N-terminus
MGGGLLQLVSYGAQDIYISGNPQITFWKVLFKRHTNFAMESIEVTFNGQADFNKRVTAIINRNADLMFRTYIQVVLPAVQIDGAANVGVTVGAGNNPQINRFRWLNYIGHRMIKTVELEIGGQRIDRQYGDWMQIWTQLTQDLGTVTALDEMVGNTHDLVLMKDRRGYALDVSCAGSELTNSCAPRAGTPARTLYIPLQFWFCRNPGLAIPLIALQYHEVRINVEFEQWINCCYYELSSSSAAPTAIQSLTAASLYIDYIYLDTEERRRFAQQTHEYLIEQLQFTGAESITSSSNKIQLNFNHPVKELVWVVQRDSFVDCSFPPPTFIAEVNGCQPFNYSDDFSTEGVIMDVLARGSLGGGNISLGVPTLIADGSSGPYLPGLGVAVGPSLAGASWLDSNFAGGNDQVYLFEDTTNYLLAKVILNSGTRCTGKTPTEVAKLQLNGQDRFTEREGRYFAYVQPYQHHTRTPTAPGICVYSFALKPEEHQPSGTCNFSRIDKATLQLTVSVNTVRSGRTAQVRVYAVNYNVLRVMSGMGGLAYSN